MRRPPRAAGEPLIGGRLLVNGLLQGVAALVVTATIYAWALSGGLDKDAVRALVFVSMVAGNIALVLGNRSLNTSWQDARPQSNPVLRWIVLGGSAGLIMVLSVPILRELFHFSVSAPHILAVGILSATGIFLLSAAVKGMLRR